MTESIVCFLLEFLTITFTLVAIYCGLKASANKIDLKHKNIIIIIMTIIGFIMVCIPIMIVFYQIHWSEMR